MIDRRETYTPEEGAKIHIHDNLDMPIRAVRKTCRRWRISRGEFDAKVAAARAVAERREVWMRRVYAIFEEEYDG